jgi:hypothetical protein
VVIGHHTDIPTVNSSVILGRICVVCILKINGVWVLDIVTPVTVNAASFGSILLALVMDSNKFFISSCLRKVDLLQNFIDPLVAGEFLGLIQKMLAGRLQAFAPCSHCVSLQMPNLIFFFLLHRIVGQHAGPLPFSFCVHRFFMRSKI